MSKPRIVIIEDNAADVRLLRAALDHQEHEYVLEVITDGEAAIRYLKEHCVMGPDPCLIVLDLHLPRYDGVAVLREIRSSPALAHVHVAMLTTVASPAEEAEVKALGVALYTRKPISWDDFVGLGRDLMSLCVGPAQRATTA